MTEPRTTSVLSLAAASPTPGDLYGRLVIVQEQCAVLTLVIVLLLVDAVALVIALARMFSLSTGVMVPGVVSGGSTIPSYF